MARTIVEKLRRIDAGAPEALPELLPHDPAVRLVRVLSLIHISEPTRRP